MVLEGWEGLVVAVVILVVVRLVTVVVVMVSLFFGMTFVMLRLEDVLDLEVKYGDR